MLSLKQSVLIFFSKLRSFLKELSKVRPFSKGWGKESSFLIGLALIGGVFLISFVAVFLNPFKTTEATLLLAFENDGQGRMFTGEVVYGMTILDALLVSSQAGQIKLGYHLDQDGKLIIEELDGYTAGIPDRELTFYLNGQKVSAQEINRVFIHPGDKIEIRIE